jgi:hypothetical protein
MLYVSGLMYCLLTSGIYQVTDRLRKHAEFGGADYYFPGLG